MLGGLTTWNTATGRHWSGCGSKWPAPMGARAHPALPGPRNPREDEVAPVRVVADARMLVVGDALETARWRLEGSERG